MRTINIAYAIDFEDDQITALAEAIGCEAVDVEQRVQPYAKAALTEYADMMIGEAPLASAAEARERRLITIIKVGLGGSMPDANRVARIFNIAQSSARALLRAVTSKHRRKLEDAIRAEIQAFLGVLNQNGETGNWEGAWLNPILIEILNDRLENANDGKARIRRDNSVLAGYIVPNGSYEWIQQQP